MALDRGYEVGFDMPPGFGIACSPGPIRTLASGEKLLTARPGRPEFRYRTLTFRALQLLVRSVRFSELGVEIEVTVSDRDTGAPIQLVFFAKAPPVPLAAESYEDWFRKRRCARRCPRSSCRSARTSCWAPSSARSGAPPWSGKDFRQFKGAEHFVANMKPKEFGRAQRWYFGQFGYLLPEAQPIDPVPCRGNCGFWRPDDDLARKLGARP